MPLNWTTPIADLPNPQKILDFHPEHNYRSGARSYAGHTGSDIDQPSKALKAGDHGVPGGENMIRFADGSVRYFTILEAKRMQTFPDDYPILGSWTEAMRQLGNAVPVKLGQIIGESLIPRLINPILPVKEKVDLQPMRNRLAYAGQTQ